MRLRTVPVLLLGVALGWAAATALPAWAADKKSTTTAAKPAAAAASAKKATCMDPPEGQAVTAAITAGWMTTQESQGRVRFIVTPPPAAGGLSYLCAW
jgi:hypothetical protein